jgi:hypothetical protein
LCLSFAEGGVTATFSESLSTTSTTNPPPASSRLNTKQNWQCCDLIHFLTFHQHQFY